MAVVAALLSMGWLAHRKPWRQVFNSVHFVSFSPDGKKLAIIHYHARDQGVPGKHYVCNVSDTVALIDPTNLSNLTVVQHEYRPGDQGPGGNHRWFNHVEFAPAGDLLYVHDQMTMRLRTWDIASGAWATNDKIGRSDVFDFKLSPDGNLLATVSLSGVSILNAKSQSPVFTRSDWSRCYAFSPDSKLFAVTKNNDVQIWDSTQQKRIGTFHENHDILDGVSCVAIAPDSDTVAMRCNEGLSVFSILTGKEQAVLPEQFEVTRHANGGYGIRSSGPHTIGARFSPDGKLLAAWGDYGVKLFDMSQGGKLQSAVSERGILCLSFSPGGKTYATGDYYGKVTIRDTATGNELRSRIIEP